MKSLPATRKNLYLKVFVGAIMLTITSGWLLTGFLGRVAEKGFKDRTDREANLIVSFVKDNLDDVEHAAKALSQVESMIVALSSGSPADLENANKVLDRYKSSFEMSICYLLDRNGLAVASSNRNEKTGFVGKSFAFRPFFTGAMTGRLTTYFALGLLTRERGYFVAAPVVGSSGTITGVVVVKRNIDPVGEFFRKYPHAFLVSPEGVIFIASREELLYRTLWPIDEKKHSELQASRQFGNITIEPLLAAEPRTGTYVRLENGEHYVQRLPFGSDGWSLVYMDNPLIVATYRLFGILLTCVFVLLLAFFFYVLLQNWKTLEAARELLKSKTEAAENAQRLEFVLEGSNDATWEWDMITDQGHLNKRYFEMMEYIPGEIDTNFTFFMKTIHPDDVSEVQRGVQEHLEGKTSGYGAHYRMVTKSGKIRHVMGKGKIVKYNENGRPTLMAGVVTDVTELKRLNDEVNRIHSLESIGLLAGGMAHDFNNVLNIIYGNITFAKMLAGDNTAVAEPLTDAEVACERAKELGIRLQALMQVSSPVKEPVALPVLIGDAAGALFRDSDISHTIVAAEDLLQVEADPRQIRQVFENLLTNAKEAVTTGGTVKIDIENCAIDAQSRLLLRSGHYVCIVVQDNGKGIPEGDLLKIFDPYFSTKDTYSERGLGLGLSTCHSILKRHNGHISINSKIGIGTRVTVYLPACGAEVMHAAS